MKSFIAGIVVLFFSAFWIILVKIAILGDIGIVAGVWIIYKSRDIWIADMIFKGMG